LPEGRRNGSRSEVPVNSRKYFKLFFLIISSSYFVSCMKTNPMLTQSSITATESIGCDNMQSKVFDSMYEFLEQEKAAPDLESLKQELSSQIDQLAKKQKITDTEKMAAFKTEFYKIFDLLIEESKSSKQIKTVKEHLQTLIELEMQDSSNEQNKLLNSKISRQFSKVSSLSQAMNLECQKEQTTPIEAAAPAPVNAQSRMIAGLNNAFSTAYQSCQALQIPEISQSTSDVVGIRRIGTHPDGVGGVREVYDVKAVQSTHPYIRVASAEQTGCFNVRGNPLIYDYGGEPSVANNTINFFKNVGSGSNVLGVDCSAYVSSVIAASGFRYKPGVENKAIYIRQTSAKFIDAKKSGFTCFDNITLTKTDTIKPGDIAGVRGHVVMIDKVGTDPFGLKNIYRQSQCSTITPAQFDFTVTQSSPSKNGLGINKYLIKDYLAEQGSTGRMTVLFTEMAKNACNAYFQNASIKPTSADWGIIRHSGKLECLAPRIQLANQSCVSQCQL